MQKMGFSQHHVKRVFCRRFYEANCYLFSLRWSYDFFLNETGVYHGRSHRWPRISGFQGDEMSDIVEGPYLSNESGEMGYPELTGLLSFFGDLGSPRNLPTWAETSKLCRHVLIQDLLEKLHLKTILFVQAIWLNHQPLRFVLAFKPKIAAEKRPFPSRKPPNWSHLRREVVFACVMCIHVFFVFQQPFSRPVFV